MAVGVTTMLERSPYPILALKLLGSLCPCLEKEEDSLPRQAAWAVSSVPIRWHRKLRTTSDGGNNSSTSAVGGFISGMFGGSSSSTGGGDTYDPLEGATLSVVDAPSGPQLQVSPSGLSTIRSKSIPLKLIKKVQARKGGIISSASRSGIEILDNTGRELLRFDVLKKATGGGQIATDNEEEDWETTESGSGNVEDAEESSRDDTIDQLEILVEWERRRQAYIVTLGEDESPEPYVDEYDDEDDGSTPTSPRTSARKKGALAEKGACSFLVCCLICKYSLL